MIYTFFIIHYVLIYFTTLSPYISWVLFINPNTMPLLVEELVVQLIENAPFGCKINRGQINNIEDIPEGYKVERVIPGKDITIIYIEPESN